MCSVGRRFHWSAGVVLRSSGRGCLVRRGGGLGVVGRRWRVRGPIASLVGFQDLAAGVGDESGWGTEEPVAQRFGFGFRVLPIESEVAQPGVQAAGQRCKL